MTQKTDKPLGGRAPESNLGRQAIFSAIALGIIGLGGWTMWSQSAPYHPKIDAENVTRGDMQGFSDTNVTRYD